MVNSPKYYTEATNTPKSKENSGFYHVTHSCGKCGAKFKLEEWID
jgi:hypothetical protein